MEELFQQLTIEQVLVYLAVFYAAFKGFCEAKDWLISRGETGFKKKQKLEDVFPQIEKINEKIEKITDTLAEEKKSIEETQNKIDKLCQLREDDDEQRKSQDEKVNLLLKSDMADIKAYIVREHQYFCYQKGWIDDYSLETIIMRFGYYKEEGGNSFVHDLVDDLKALPRKAPGDETRTAWQANK